MKKLIISAGLIILLFCSCATKKIEKPEPTQINMSVEEREQLRKVLTIVIKANIIQREVNLIKDPVEREYCMTQCHAAIFNIPGMRVQLEK